MKAVQAQREGTPEVLSVKDIDKPEPNPDEVRVEVRSAGVNVIDCIIRQGIVPDSMEAEFPWIPGWDVSGIVEATGDAADRFEAGYAVYGMAKNPFSGKTYAEYTTLPEDHLTRKPQGLSHREAAGIPMAALTADYALFEAGGLRPGETVLIHAAAGGVGHLAIQLAQNAGARVLGTASGRNRDFLNQFGVDRFVNYRNEDFEKLDESVDLVIDALGEGILERSIQFASSGGRVITLPAPPSEEQRALAEKYSVDCQFFSITSTATPDQWERLDRLVRDGVMDPTISGKYSLEDATDAHRESEDGHVRGKLILTMD